MAEMLARKKEEKKPATVEESFAVVATILKLMNHKTNELAAKLESIDLAPLQATIHDLELDYQNLVAEVRDLRKDIAELAANMKQSNPELRAKELDVLKKLDQYLKDWV